MAPDEIKNIKTSPHKRITVIGNTGAGKTTLSRKLSVLHGLPVFHVDSYQFLAGMQIRPHQETIATLTEIQNQEKWILDGYGPLDILEKRLAASDLIVFIDWPLWLHAFWLIQRQMTVGWRPRKELPKGCSEFSLAHTLKLFRTLIKVHRQMRPEMLRILNRPQNKSKLRMIQTRADWNQLLRRGSNHKI